MFYSENADLSSSPHIPTDQEECLKWLYDTFGKKLTGYAIKNYRLNEDAAWELTYKTIYKLREVIHGYVFDSPQKLDQ